MRSRQGVRAGGFTLLEVIIVMLVAATLMAMGIPALQQMIHRSRLEGTARECAVLCQRARLEAIKVGVPIVVRFDTADHTLESWLDANGDGVMDNDEQIYEIVPLPGNVLIDGPDTTEGVTGFTRDADGGQVSFLTDGSVDADGEVHFGDARLNYLRMQISPRATAHVELTKWDEVEAEWVRPGDEGKPWTWN